MSAANATRHPFGVRCRDGIAPSPNPANRSKLHHFVALPKKRRYVEILRLISRSRPHSIHRDHRSRMGSARRRLLKGYRRSLRLKSRLGLENRFWIGDWRRIVEVISSRHMLRYMSRFARHNHRIIALTRPRTSHLRLPESSRDDRDLHRVFHLLVENRAKNDVGVFMRSNLNYCASLLHFGQLQRIRARDIDQNRSEE